MFLFPIILTDYEKTLLLLIIPIDYEKTPLLLIIPIDYEKMLLLLIIYLMRSKIGWMALEICVLQRNINMFRYALYSGGLETGG